VQHTVRHTLRAEVGAVTQVALSSLWRPATHELGGRAIAAPARGATAGHAWMQRADVRSNVPTVLVLEAASPLASDESRGAWQVVDANGDMVPWQNAPVVLSRELPAGRHDVPIVLIAPEGITSAPAPVVRLRIVTGAR
jgi:hypothetical protein